MSRALIAALILALAAGSALAPAPALAAGKKEAKAPVKGGYLSLGGVRAMIVRPTGVRG